MMKDLLKTEDGGTSGTDKKGLPDHIREAQKIAPQICSSYF